MDQEHRDYEYCCVICKRTTTDAWHNLLYHEIVRILKDFPILANVTMVPNELTLDVCDQCVFTYNISLNDYLEH